MPKIQNLPKLGVNMTEALITVWVVKEGDQINAGDHILDAETDKSTQEFLATESGILAKILVPAGEKIEVGKPIAILLDPGEKAPEAYTAAAATATAATPAAQALPTAATVAQAATAASAAYSAGQRVKISPLAKKTAALMGIDYRLATPGTPGGRIVKADILAYAEDAKRQPAAVKTTQYQGENEVTQVIPLTGVRKVIAERMTESNVTKPNAALTLHADAGRLIEWRENLKAAGRQTGYNELLVYIVARALREFPALNSVMADDGVHVLKDINIGVAVDTDKGLMVPVIRKAGEKGVHQISDEFREAADRAKAGKAGPDDLTGGTFTITNLGMYEIEQFTPVLNPPECCILAVGTIVREPVAASDGDRVEIRQRVQLTLVFDHRMTDGAPAAKLLQRVKHLIEWPYDLMI